MKQVVTHQFYAVWIEMYSGELRWMGLDEDRAPFLFETRQAAEECAPAYGKRWVVVRVPLEAPEMPKPKPRGRAELRPPRRKERAR